MFKQLAFTAFIPFLVAAYSGAQTTSGVVTGVITDSTGAVVPGVQIVAANQGTNISRTTTSDSAGYYTLPQLPPGVYKILVTKQGFAGETMPNIQLEVNQSMTLNFVLKVSATQQTVLVTSAPPALNTTSATISTVVNHEETIDLPLNGREFTQLTLLTPGAVPVQQSQQGLFTVALGVGGISPSVNGQNAYQNNFTIDGTLNNSLFTDTWAIAPPPDAIQEFNVQSHITDAKFAISSGANINLVTRSGTNTFHGSLWEFLRNDALDANTFPATARLPYRQNQYGIFLGGPATIPKVFNGKDRTWFAGYWEGFRSTLSQSLFASTLTSAMRQGDFSGVLGAQVGVDSLGRPEYANELYDPLTSRPDPGNPGLYLRDPLPGNMIPPDRMNQAAAAILNRYYPSPNLNVPEGTLPNYQFTGSTITASDVFGLRVDQKLTENDTLFARFNRANQHVTNPEDFSTYFHSLSNYANQAGFGYTHLFNPQTILDFRAGYTYTNFFWGDLPAGTNFINSIHWNWPEAFPPLSGIPLGPDISLTNGYGGVSQFAALGGPLEGLDFHADLSKVIGNHTLGAGIMYYHLKCNTNGGDATTNFTQNATAQDGLPGPTGYGPASFLIGVLDSYGPWAGDVGADITVNWYGLYVQDLWQVTPRLAITAGLRWDYVSPPNFHKIVSSLDPFTGQFLATGAVPPFVTAPNVNSRFFTAQYNGYEPRFGLTYKATSNTVLHGAFAILDDHNNTLDQEDQNIKVSWPTAIIVNETSLDLGIPTTYFHDLPPSASFVGPGLPPYASAGANPNNKIPYSIEYNGGVQQQLPHSFVLKVDYVGSVGRHQYIYPTANTAEVPGPGPISKRQPFPQYGGPFGFAWNAGQASYNALQLNLQRSWSSGVDLMASYTWSKSLDWSSDPYGSGFPNFYNLASNYGPSDYNLTNLFVFSGVYALPVGRGKDFLSDASGIVQAIAGGWNLGGIVSVHSGVPFDVLAGGDIANTGGPSQRSERTGADPYATNRSYKMWLNPAAFAVPTVFTFGNESRNDLTGPVYRNVDFSAFKNWTIERFTLQFRAEFFNLFNTTNYSTPEKSLQTSAFGQILSAAGPGREIQFAAKVMF